MKAVPVRLEGPLQAWGVWCVGDQRPTLDAPTRSGVLGLVACCLGITRGDTADLLRLHASCRVQVRVDRRGTRLVDDQTIQGLDEVKMADGYGRASNTRQTIQSKRTYLADASFVALVETDDTMATRISDALRSPAYVPFLGRKSCPPSVPLFVPSLDAVEGSTEEVFARVPRADRSDSRDLYLDGDVAHPHRLRRLRQRDALNGPLPRQFAERFVTHVRPPWSTPTDDERDTIDDWMPR
jgi:CRISPR system Cascade subunit CasD